MTKTLPHARVLVAEDEALIRLDLSEMLTEEGFEVVGAVGDGEQAVQQAEQLRPDLVILDVKMPVLDGIAAAERIAGARIAPVVILTAFSQRDLVERASDAGAMAYLVKPSRRRTCCRPSTWPPPVRRDRRAGGGGPDLTQRLETRKIVERAKGVLMDEHGMTEPEAFRWIQRAAMNRRTSMRAVAAAVLKGLAEQP